jgi:metal-dependent amidase/aminoacylase/carboxypeptidase family protein
MQLTGGEKPYAPVRSDTGAAELFGESLLASSSRRFPAIGQGPPTFAGTDMGNVSQVVPTIHPMLGLGCFPIVNHQAEFTAVCKGPAARAAIVDGAIGMACSAAGVASIPAQRSRLMAHVGPAAS